VCANGTFEAVVLVDTREQMPWCLAHNHPKLDRGEKRVGSARRLLRRGHAGYPGARTQIHARRHPQHHGGPGALHSFVRPPAQFRWKAILIEATYEDMKSPYANIEGWTEAHPNAVVGTLDAIEAKFGIPVLYTSRVRSWPRSGRRGWLSKHFTYWWLEEHGHGRVLIDEDGL